MLMMVLEGGDSLTSELLAMAMDSNSAYLLDILWATTMKKTISRKTTSIIGVRSGESFRLWWLETLHFAKILLRLESVERRADFTEQEVEAFLQANLLGLPLPLHSILPLALRPHRNLREQREPR